MAPAYSFGAICVLIVICFIPVNAVRFSIPTWASECERHGIVGRECHLFSCPNGYNDLSIQTNGLVNRLLCYGIGRCCQQNDADECQLGTHDCHQTLADCTNTIGSYTCACKGGYAGDGTVCVDVDECKTQNICGPHAICDNTPGSYQCTCVTGFHMDSTTTCVDDDECLSNNACGPNTKCSNNEGSFTCPCLSGYQGNGATLTGCTDINECDNPNICGLNQRCSNIPGSYQCLCKSGFQRDFLSECVDIDECGSINACGPNTACANNAGSFTCPCLSGYEGSGAFPAGCTDINECQLTTPKCSNNADCQNLAPGFTCTCRVNYFGSAYTIPNGCKPKSLNHPDCGLIGPARIAHGTVHTPCGAPYQMSIRRFLNVNVQNQPLSLGQSFHVTGGILIDSTHVLLAALSLIRSGRLTASDPSYQQSIFVVGGEYNLNVPEIEQMRRIKSVSFHPSSNYKLGDDFQTLIASLDPLNLTTFNQQFPYAIIEVDTPFSINNCVRPACIPFEEEYPEQCGPSACEITGFGINQNSEQSQFLQVGNVQLFEKSSCEAIHYYRNQQESVRYPVNVKCGISVDEVRPCIGDFGGPVVCKDAASGRFVLEAITFMESFACNKTDVEFQVADVRSAITWLKGFMTQ